MWTPPVRPDELYHYGVKGMRWGRIRRRIRRGFRDAIGLTARDEANRADMQYKAASNSNRLNNMAGFATANSRPRNKREKNARNNRMNTLLGSMVESHTNQSEARRRRDAARRRYDKTIVGRVEKVLNRLRNRINRSRRPRITARGATTDIRPLHRI